MRVRVIELFEEKWEAGENAEEPRWANQLYAAQTTAETLLLTPRLEPLEPLGPSSAPGKSVYSGTAEPADMSSLMQAETPSDF